MPLRPITDVVEELCERLAALEGATDSDNQTLTASPAGGPTTTIAISGGNTITIAHPTPPTVPTPVICSDRKIFASNPSGWLGITAGTRVPAAWTDVVPQWRTLLTATAPSCPTELGMDIDLGTSLHYARRTRIYHRVGTRLLVNGAAVRTYTSRAYPYSDERSDTNPDVVEPLQYEFKHVGVDYWARPNIPAGATVEVQVAHRVREVAPQASAWSRAYVGLRSQAKLTFLPTDIQTGETP